MPTADEQHIRDATYLGLTRSTCPECLTLVNAKIVSQNGKVYLQKFCPAHGRSSALISEDLEYYLRTREYEKPGAMPHRFATTARKGCPEDCGLCPEHEQHTCHPIVEITDRCDLDCPICLADNQQRGFLPVAAFSEIVDNLIAAEGNVENITLSGGEPSLHPDFFELVAAADRLEVSRVSLVTNGSRIAKDLDFCRRLKEKNIYVILQWDGTDDNIYQQLRGRPLARLKEQALDNLARFDIPTQLIYVAARGINEHGLGEAEERLLNTDHILSLAIQPLTFTKPGLGDPMGRLTVAGVRKALEQSTNGLLRADDFIPLPCPNPECVSLTYLLRLDEQEFLPFTRFVDMQKHLHLLSRSATLPPNPETENALHDIINDLWSTAGEIPDSERIMNALRRATLEMFPAGGSDLRAKIAASERQAKSIFIHHYMDRYNFDLARAVKCCHHYPRPDGRIMSICAFNLFHRHKEANYYVA